MMPTTSAHHPSNIPPTTTYHHNKEEGCVHTLIIPFFATTASILPRAHILDLAGFVAVRRESTTLALPRSCMRSRRPSRLNKTFKPGSSRPAATITRPTVSLFGLVWGVLEAKQLFCLTSLFGSVICVVHDIIEEEE
jgi:hypothetical protein